MRFCWTLLSLMIALGLLPATQSHADGSVDSQLESDKEAVEKNERAARLARRAGRSSIARGVKNMRVGKATFKPPLVKLGAVQIARGLLGLLAAKKAQELAEIARKRAAYLDQLKQKNSDRSSMVKGYSAGNGILGDSNGDSEAVAPSGASTKFDPDDIALPEVKEALMEMKEAYGLTKRDVLKTLHDKKDDKYLLTEGPKLVMTSDEYKAALKKDESSISNDSDFAVGLVAESSGSSLQAPTPAADRDQKRIPLLAQANAEPSVSLATGGPRQHLLHPGGGAGGDDEEYLNGEELDLARRQLASLTDTDELNLFDVVHRKYQEKQRDLLKGEELRAATVQTE